MGQIVAREIKSGEYYLVNLIDKEIIGLTIYDNNVKIYLNPSYFSGREVDDEEAVNLIRRAPIINLIGNRSVGLALKAGYGSELGVRIISGIPFLMIYKFRMSKNGPV